MMSQFILVYKGEATDMSEMTQEEGMEVMAKWGVWMENVGTALTDIGAPFGQGTSVVDDGSAGSAAPLTGYSIVEAADMAGAQALCDKHPFLSEGAGNFAIDVYELLPVPMEG
ncbi:MAG: YciI family protein [Acidimicrobiia bacterium]